MRNAELTMTSEKGKVKSEERKVKSGRRSLFSLFISLSLFSLSLFSLLSCGNIIEPPKVNTPVASGYGKISVSLTAGEGEAARTVFPSTVFDKCVYTFTRAGQTAGAVKAPDNSGFFTLEVGNYTVLVQAYTGSAEPYTLAASGVSPQFSVGPGDNDPVTVRLTATAAGGQGKLSYTFTWPAGAAAEITLQKWPGLDDITLNPVNVPQGNGVTQTLQLEAGFYLLTVLASKNGLYAGVSETVHVYPALTTVYTKNYADDDIVHGQFTVTFDANGGTPAPEQQTVDNGDIVTEPAAMTRGGNYEFDAWYKEAAFINKWNFATDTVTGNITLYAKWNQVVSSGNLAYKLNWLSTNAVSNGNYILKVNADESLAPCTLSYSDRCNITVTLRGVDANRTVRLSSNGRLFTVNSGVTLVLDNNITLQGRSGNSMPLVQVNSGGTLVMNAGSAVTGNTNTYYNPSGGGVYVGSSGTFTMYGGKISGNTASSSGGGVCAGGATNVGGTFTMYDGEISGNTSLDGGGVWTNGTFTMYGGTISGNTATSSSNSYGGGVRATTFTMTGGEISGNTATSDYAHGGGVYATTFTMHGGTISGNTANEGGGVRVSSRDIFLIVTGTVYGSNEANTSLRNKATSGAALYVYNDRTGFEPGTAQRGTFSGTTWNRRGNLSTTDNTIRVVNGVLQ